MSKTKKSILILNGPNLNMLGRREPKIYGRTTLADIEKTCAAHGKKLGLAVTCRQSNVEGELVTLVQEASKKHAAIVINAGAYTHTSIALHDAIKASALPVVEVHISNIYQRESFRHVSYIAPVALGSVCGFGADGYLVALDALVRRL